MEAVDDALKNAHGWKENETVLAVTEFPPSTPLKIQSQYQGILAWLVTRPLTHPSNLDELLIKTGQLYSLYSWLSSWIHTGNRTYQPYTLFT